LIYFRHLYLDTMHFKIIHILSVPEIMTYENRRTGCYFGYNTLFHHPNHLHLVGPTSHQLVYHHKNPVLQFHLFLPSSLIRIHTNGAHVLIFTSSSNETNIYQPVHNYTLNMVHVTDISIKLAVATFHSIVHSSARLLPEDVCE